LAPRTYVFFDVDDTLIEWKASWREAFAQAAREAGVEVSPDEAWQSLTTAFSTFYKDCIRQHAASGDEEAFWVDYDGRILRMLGVGRGLRRATERVLELLEAPDSIRLYSEVPQVLERLTECGARLGIVTGRPRAGPHLELLGIGHYFDPVIDAFATGSVKSEGSMFLLAAEAAAREGRTAWHVGDSYQDDVEGARAVGLRPVLVDRRGEHPDADCLRIENLRTLPEMIARGERSQ